VGQRRERLRSRRPDREDQGWRARWPVPE
jgi:hypothetical protein